MSDYTIGITTFQQLAEAKVQLKLHKKKLEEHYSSLLNDEATQQYIQKKLNEILPSIQLASAEFKKAHIEEPGYELLIYTDDDFVVKSSAFSVKKGSYCVTYATRTREELYPEFWEYIALTFGVKYRIYAVDSISSGWE